MLDNFHLPTPYGSRVGRHCPDPGFRPFVGRHIPERWSPADLEVPPIAWFDALDLSATIPDTSMVTNYTDKAGVPFVPFNSIGVASGARMEYNTTPNGKPSLYFNRLGQWGGFQSSIDMPETKVSIFVLWKKSASAGVYASYFTSYWSDPYNHNGSYLCTNGSVAGGSALFFEKKSDNSYFGSNSASALDVPTESWDLYAGGSNADRSIWAEKNGVNIPYTSSSGTQVFNGPQIKKLYRGCLGTSYTNSFYPLGQLASEIILSYTPTAIDKARIYAWMRERYLGVGVH